MNTYSKTLKSGTNKGNRRVWIEGDFLTVNGLRRGNKLVRTMVDGALILTPVSNDAPKAKGEKRHSIAGTASRPIIDLSGAWVSDFMDGRTHVDITIVDRVVTIRHAAEIVAMAAQ